MKIIPHSLLSLTLIIASTSQGFGQFRQSEPVSNVPVYSRVPIDDLLSILPPPPVKNSGAVRDELKLLHRLEKQSSTAEKSAAQADSHNVDIFVYHTVLGNDFSASALPLTAALSVQVHGDSDYWNGLLKNVYKRPRPYRYDSTLRPLCGTDPSYSYPSGHSMTGYLEAMLLAEIVPEQKEAIFQRADDYAHNRWVCGAHYPSDTQMAHQIAATLFGIMLANPAFDEKLSAARVETRTHLGIRSLP